MPLAITAGKQGGGLVIADDCFGLWVEVKHPSNPRPDIGEVNQGRGSVAGHHVGIGHLGIIGYAVEGSPVDVPRGRLGRCSAIFLFLGP